MAYLVFNDSCPLCLHSGSREIYRESYLAEPLLSYLIQSYALESSEIEDRLCGQDYVLKQCHYCGLVYQHGVPNDDFQKIIYDQWIDSKKSYEKYLQRSACPNFLTSIKRGILGALKLLDKNRAEVRVLDFGAGWGIASDVLRGEVGECLVGEISNNRVKKLTERGHVCVDVFDVPNSSIDFVYTEQVLEHLVNVGQWLSVLASKLAPGGILRISVPNGIGIPNLVGKRPWLPSKPRRWSLNPVAPLEHINCFDIRTLDWIGPSLDLERVAKDASGGGVIHDILRRTPVGAQEAIEHGVFRVTGKKVALAQYYRRVA